MVTPAIASPKTRPIHPRAFTQARELQSLLMSAANSGEITASALSQVARAWSELEERKRVLKMRPKPRDVDVAPRVRASNFARAAVRKRIAMAASPAVAASDAVDASAACSGSDARDSSPQGDAPRATSASDAPACAMDASVSAPAKR